MDNGQFVLIFNEQSIIHFHNSLTMKENILKNKSFDFAIRIVNLHKYLKKKHEEYIIAQ